MSRRGSQDASAPLFTVSACTLAQLASVITWVAYSFSAARTSWTAAEVLSATLPISLVVFQIIMFGTALVHSLGTLLLAATAFAGRSSSVYLSNTKHGTISPRPLGMSPATLVNSLFYGSIVWMVFGLAGHMSWMTAASLVEEGVELTLSSNLRDPVVLGLARGETDDASGLMAMLTSGGGMSRATGVVLRRSRRSLLSISSAGHGGLHSLHSIVLGAAPVRRRGLRSFASAALVVDSIAGSSGGGSGALAASAAAGLTALEGCSPGCLDLRYYEFLQGGRRCVCDTNELTMLQGAAINTYRQLAVCLGVMLLMFALSTLGLMSAAAALGGGSGAIGGCSNGGSSIACSGGGLDMGRGVEVGGLGPACCLDIPAGCEARAHKVVRFIQANQKSS